MPCLCEYAIEQREGEPISHDPRCESKPSNVSAKITPQGKAYIEWLQTNPELSTLAAFAAGWRAGRAP